MSFRNWKFSLSINVSSLMGVHIVMISGGAAVTENMPGCSIISITILLVTIVVMEDNGMETIRQGTLVLGGSSAVVETVAVDINVQGEGTLAWASVNKSRTSLWELKMGLMFGMMRNGNGWKGIVSTGINADVYRSIACMAIPMVILPCTSLKALKIWTHRLY